MPFDAEITEKSRTLIRLEKARQRIARGWCQGRMADENGSVCIIGALAGLGDRDVTAVVEALGFEKNAIAISMWNDAYGRTQAEVLARFDAAIARLQS